MKESQVKEKIGEENWKDFLKWMHGHTVSIYPDGSTNYYEYDVSRYTSQLRWKNE